MSGRKLFDGKTEAKSNKKLTSKLSLNKLSSNVLPEHKITSKEIVVNNNTIMEDDSVSDDDDENPNKTRIQFNDSIMVGELDEQQSSNDSDIDEIDEIKELTLRTGLNTTTKKKKTTSSRHLAKLSSGFKSKALMDFSEMSQGDSEMRTNDGFERASVGVFENQIISNEVEIKQD